MATLLRSFNELTQWQPFCITSQTYCSGEGEYNICREQRLRCAEQGVDCREPCRLGRRDDYPRNGWDADVVDIGPNNEVINNVPNDQVVGLRGVVSHPSGAGFATLPIPHTNIVNFHTFRKQAAILKECRDRRESNTASVFPAVPAESEPDILSTNRSGLREPETPSFGSKTASMPGVQQLRATQAKAGGRTPSRPRVHNVHEVTQKREAESPNSFKGFDADDGVDGLCIQTLSEAVDQDIKDRAASSRDPAAETRSSSSQCNQDDWSEGQVRVLVIFRSDENESEAPDRIERWCRACKITDVQTLKVSQASEHMLMRILTDALTALGARCSPGDVCTVFLARLPELSNPEEVTPSFSSPIFLSCLPRHVTVVCISDERNSLERVGLDEKSLQKNWSDNLRAIVMLVSSQRPCKGSFFVDVLLETSRALSLLDGPCGLHSQAFFEELSDQAYDLAAILGVGAPQMSIHAHPNNDIASDVRWPIAKAPQNGARKRSVSRNSLDGLIIPCANESVERRETHYANIAKVVACTQVRASRSRELHLPQSSEIGNMVDNDDTKADSPSSHCRKGRAGNSGTPKKRRSARSTSGKAPKNAGSVPGNIDQMAAMFSGGFLDKAGRDPRGLSRSHAS